MARAQYRAVARAGLGLLAKDIGLDLAKYDACLQSQRYTGRIEASYEEGEARGVQSTPTFFVAPTFCSTDV